MYVEKKREKAKKLFFVVAIFYILSILYLLFFNYGLSIKQTNGNFYVVNNSMHAIKNVEIYAKFLDNNSNEEKIMEIPLLKPNEQKQIFLEKEGYYKIIVKAPFHISVISDIVVARVFPNSEISLILPKEVFFVDENITVVTKICLLENKDFNFTIEIEENNHFQFETSKKSVTIESNSCEEISFIGIALLPGETNIKFKFTSNFKTKEAKTPKIKILEK